MSGLVLAEKEEPERRHPHDAELVERRRLPGIAELQRAEIAELLGPGCNEPALYPNRRLARSDRRTRWCQDVVAACGRRARQNCMTRPAVEPERRSNWCIALVSAGLPAVSRSDNSAATVGQG